LLSGGTWSSTIDRIEGDIMRRRSNIRHAYFSAAVLIVASAIALPVNAAGTWTVAPTNPGTGGGAFGLWLLTDGTVLSHGSALNNWVILTPDKTGSYAKGTWKTVASSVHTRGGAQQHILKDGRFFQAGGEYIDGPACTPALCPTAEIYDPVANVWKDAATAPYAISDTGSATLADGRILDSTGSGSQIQIYDSSTDKWSMGASMPLGSGDENAWASLQNGGVLAVGYNNAGAAIYNPATDKWIRTGAVPTGFNTGDTGGISLMFDGRVFVYGLAGKSYIYTPGPTAADPGTWVLGPAMLNGDEAEDEYTDVLPDGKVMGALVAVMFGPGVILQEFDPVSNTVASATPPPDTGNPYPIGYVNLPNGQVMVTAGSRNWIYTSDTLPNDAWRPMVTSVVYNGTSNNYTLTGTQISGLVNGADEGDDMTMAENYPIVWLTDSSNNVYYCRSFNFSNMMPSKGNTPETCQFTTPAGLPQGSYNLYVSAVGVQSKNPFPFTVGQSSSVDGGVAATSDGGGADGAGGASGGADAGAVADSSTARATGGATGTGGATSASGGTTASGGAAGGVSGATSGTGGGIAGIGGANNAGGASSSGGSTGLGGTTVVAGTGGGPANSGGTTGSGGLGGGTVGPGGSSGSGGTTGSGGAGGARVASGVGGSSGAAGGKGGSGATGAATSSGCSCTTAGAAATSHGPGGLLLLGGLAALMARRRRDAVRQVCRTPSGSD
jgi:MYXO-CTERM domain-containing protein